MRLVPDRPEDAPRTSPKHLSHGFVFDIASGSFRDELTQTIRPFPTEREGPSANDGYPSGFGCGEPSQDRLQYAAIAEIVQFDGAVDPGNSLELDF